MTAWFLAWFSAVWDVLQASGAWLLFGFLIGGLFHEFVPPAFIERHLGRRGLLAVAKAAAIGVPLPLCSCSVIPVATSLRKSGASKGATASFLISTPEIGVDSFFLSAALLGVPLTLLRIAAAFFSAFFVGASVDILDNEDSPPADDHKPPPFCEKEASCCAHDSPSVKPRSLQGAVRYGFVDLADDVAVSLFWGILLAGLLAVIIPADFFLSMHLSGAASMLIMLFVSMPLYVCASASTPLAAVLLGKGLPPGAALVFLLGGPATNAATMLVVRRQLGTKSLAIYLVGIAGVSLVCGFIANWLLPDMASAISPAAREHDHSSSILTIGAVALTIVISYRLFLKLARKLTTRKHAGSTEQCTH